MNATKTESLHTLCIRGDLESLKKRTKGSRHHFTASKSTKHPPSTNSHQVDISEKGGKRSQIKKFLTSAHHSSNKADSSPDHSPLLQLNEQKQNLLHVTAAEGNCEIIKFLIDQHSFSVDSVDAHGNSPLHLACQNGHLKAIACLMKVYQANTMVQNKDKEYPLHLFLRTKESDSPIYEEVLSCLIQKTSSLNTQNSRGETPLMIACSCGAEKAVISLLENHVRTDSQSFSYGETAVHLAVRGGYRRIVGLLFNQGADVTITSNNGTPKDLAQKLGQLTIMGDLEVYERILNERKHQKSLKSAEHTAPQKKPVGSGVKITTTHIDGPQKGPSKKITTIVVDFDSDEEEEEDEPIQAPKLKIQTSEQQTQDQLSPHRNYSSSEDDCGSYSPETKGLLCAIAKDIDPLEQLRLRESFCMPKKFKTLSQSDLLAVKELDRLCAP